MNFEIDKKFMDYYNGKLKHISLYLIDECNLRCIQCFYKLNIEFHLYKNQIEFEDAVKLIYDFKEMGAEILTLIGGEPTLYGKNENNASLLKLIKIAKEDLKYKYVRIDTNGKFDSKLLEKDEFKVLDEISFSLDGPNSEINDFIRGQGSFDSCLKNIKHAIKLGYNVELISCVSKLLLQKDYLGERYLDHLIKLAENIGVRKFNCHALIKTGLPRNCYDGNINISIKEWLQVKEEIQHKIESGEYNNISIKLPQSFVEKENFFKDSEKYGYCSCKSATRAFVHPNGMIHACPLLIGTPYSIAKFYNNKIIWDSTSTNELISHKLQEKTPCTNQYKKDMYGDYLPICVYL